MLSTTSLLFSLSAFLCCCNGVWSATANLTRIESDLRNHFKDIRNYNTENGVGLDAARQYVKQTFSGLKSLTVVEDTKYLDTPVGSNSTNFLGIWKGKRWDTAEDKIYLLGAHYDTVATSPGVDDNGSGMAALLEVARLTNEASCGDDHNSVIFAAFDFEEVNLMGSKYFVDDYLRNSKGTFSGAIILDQVLNFNNKTNSQTLPQGFEQGFPEIYQQVADGGFKGDFLAGIYRTGVDQDLITKLSVAWNLGDSKPAYLRTVPLPSNWTTITSGPYNDFLRSDHRNFWQPANMDDANDLGFKAIFLTDSGEFRQACVQDTCGVCYHMACDNVERMVTPENLEFIKFITSILYNVIANFADMKNCNNAAVGLAATQSWTMISALMTIYWLFINKTI